MTVAVSTPLTQNQPIRGDAECSALARVLPTLWLYLVTAKVNVGLCVWDGICLRDAVMEGVCVCMYICVCVLGCVMHLRVFFGEACAAEHTDVSFRGGYQ